MRRVARSSVCAVLALSACALKPAARSETAGRTDLWTRRITFGTSVEGRPLEARIFGTGPETVLYLATIHGNEAAGTPLLESFGRLLQAEPERCRRRRVILVPVMNPDGLARGTRYNALGVDLNRNFPAANRQDTPRNGTALSEPESAALERLIESYPPSRVVSLHQPRSCVDFDGPSESLAREMSGACGLPVEKLGSLPGSLGSYLGVDRGTPMVTLELPAEASALKAETLFARYGPALLAALSSATSRSPKSGPPSALR